MIALYNSWCMQVTWTGTAPTLQALMNTAVAGSWDKALAQKCDMFLLSFEWTARFTIDGQTPTAAIWLQWAATTSASNQYWRQSSVDKILIIWAVKVNVQCWRSNWWGY